MSAILVLVLLALVAMAASIWGVDSRDGQDWRCPTCGRHLGPHVD